MPVLDFDNPKPSFFQRKQISIFGKVHVGDYQRPGWSMALPHYMFRCPRHGYVVNYHNGFAERLICPKCRQEMRKVD